MEQQEQQKKEGDGEVKYECPDGRAVSKIGSGGGGSAINTTATVLRLDAFASTKRFIVLPPIVKELVSLSLGE